MYSAVERRRAKRERETERDREKGWCVGFGERERWGNLESSVRALSPLKAGVCVCV